MFLGDPELGLAGLGTRGWKRPLLSRRTVLTEPGGHTFVMADKHQGEAVTYIASEARITTSDLPL